MVRLTQTHQASCRLAAGCCGQLRVLALHRSHRTCASYHFSVPSASLAFVHRSITHSSPGAPGLHRLSGNYVRRQPRQAVTTAKKTDTSPAVFLPQFSSRKATGYNNGRCGLSLICRHQCCHERGHCRAHGACVRDRARHPSWSRD